MSRRRFDTQRIHVNELRRIRLARQLPWIIGPYYRDELTAALDIAMGDPQHIEAGKIVAEREARKSPLRRLCSNGRCTVFVDRKTGRTMYSMGPAGCCDE